MKKFKSKYLIVIIVLLLVLSVILYFSLSNKEETTLSPQPEQTLTTCEVKTLSSPRNLTIVNNLLTWQEVEAADGYIVTVDGYEYLTETNVFNLSNIKQEFGYVKVRATSYSNNLESVNSIERYFDLNKNDELIKKLEEKILEQLSNNYQIEIDSHLKNVIEDIAVELYFEGIDDALYESYYLTTDQLIENFDKENFDPSKVLKSFYQLLDNELSDFANVLLLKNSAILLLEVYNKVNLSDFKFDLLIEELHKLTSIDIETVSLTVRFIRDLSSLVFEQGSDLVEQIFKVIESDIKSLSSVDLSYDLIVMKNQIMNNFLLEMPSFDEYDYSINILSKLYSTLIPNDMAEDNLIELFKSDFYNFYLEQHRLIHYLNHFNLNHLSDLLPILQNLYNSFGKEIFENNLKELIEYYQTGDFDQFLKELLIYGLTTDGNLDQTQYERTYNGLKQLSIDLQNKDYQYLEGPLTTFFTELFEYLEIEHSSSIIVNPLIKYLTDGGSFLKYFKEQFDVTNYITFNQDMSFTDLYNIIKEWNESDFDKLTHFEGDIVDLINVLNELGLEEVIIIDSDSINDLLEMRFIVHIVDLINEFNDKNSFIDKLSYLYEHYDIQTIVLPLVKNLMVDLDDRYATNINIDQFLINSLVNLGADPTLILITLNDLKTFMTNYDMSFNVIYEKPDIEVKETDSEQIENSIKNNILYFVFGENYNDLFDFIVNSNEELKKIFDLYKNLQDGNIKVEDLLKDLNIQDIINSIPGLEDVEITEIPDLDELRMMIDDFLEGYFNSSENNNNEFKELIPEELIDQIIDWFKNNGYLNIE